jgi:hypothetical protein
MLPAGSLPGAGFMRNPMDGDLLNSPLLSGVVAIIFHFWRCAWHRLWHRCGHDPQRC